MNSGHGEQDVRTCSNKANLHTAATAAGALTDAEQMLPEQMRPVHDTQEQHELYGSGIHFSSLIVYALQQETTARHCVKAWNKAESGAGERSD